MKVLIFGKSGQLAQELLRTAPSGLRVICLGREQVDLTDRASVTAVFEQENPAIVINASAYTAVDQAESYRDTAFAVNALGVKNIALACAQYNCRLLHVSTDFVFGSQSAMTPSGIAPLLADAPKAPMGIYGESKLAGEQAIQEILPNNTVIVRTAWVYSVFGNNFVKTMLRLMAEKPELGIIYDQIGTPTWAKGLAQWLWCVAQNNSVSGVFHWTDAGVASWYDFAVAIQELALQKGLLAKRIPIKPIPTSAYPTPAKRPSYSVLDKQSAEAAAGLNAQHWQAQLSEMLDELKI